MLPPDLPLVTPPQGAQPSFSAVPVPLLNYSAAVTGGLMAIAGKTTDFALRFSGETGD